MKQRIEVTTRHIRSATPGESDQCPIALALKQAFPGIRILVFGTVAIFGERAIRLPDCCNSYAINFDETGEMPEFGFLFDTQEIAEDWRWN